MAPENEAEAPSNIPFVDWQKLRVDNMRNLNTVGVHFAFSANGNQQININGDIAPSKVNALVKAVKGVLNA